MDSPQQGGDSAQPAGTPPPATVAEDVKPAHVAQAEFAALLAQSVRYPLITSLLLAINVILFVIMAACGVNVLEPTSESLIRWGANYGPLTLGGQWWRLLSCTFLHIGFIHLALNMWVLNDIGRLVERLFGNGLFLVIYLGAGILGSMASVCTHPEIVSAGASGAVFGLYGALVGFSVRQKKAIPKTVLIHLRNSSIGFIGYNLFYGFTSSGIDNSAHIGGLLCGAMLGFVAAMPLDPQLRKALGARRTAVTFAVFVAMLVAAVLCLPGSAYSEYVKFRNLFVAEEEKAVSSYNECLAEARAGNLGDEAMAGKLESECLSRWATIVESGRNVELSKWSDSGRQYRMLMQLATLRAEALRKLIDGLRKKDASLVRQATELQEKADRVIENTGKGTN